ncbi:hypothetical protein OS493_009056 [Desmophyllum pertusum]|uniref:Uncharacterized protein n=1 Tax=Desmophyllum pertusum TaxID=174260 RepID=A0A9W9ZIH3_9CNID|nr:hypothetical protein OS493_009056 [Desmophyllum pertusum]
MDDLTNACQRLSELFDSEETKSKAMESHEKWLQETMGVSRSIKDRISGLQLEMQERASLYSTHSSRSKTSHKLSKHSSSSRKSSKHSSSSLPGRAEMIAKAARLGAELKFHDIESEKIAALKKQEDDVKKLQIIKELAATTAEIEAVTKMEEEDYSVTSNRNDDRELPEEEDPYGRIEEYLQSQLDSVVNSSTPKAATGLEKTSSSETKAQTNVTFTMTPNSHQSPTATLNPAAPPFTVKHTPMQTIASPVIVHPDWSKKFAMFCMKTDITKSKIVELLAASANVVGTKLTSLTMRIKGSMSQLRM